jgi:hypothetical protein
MPMFGSAHLLAHAQKVSTGVFEPFPTDGLGIWFKADDGALNKIAAQFVSANAEVLSITDNTSLHFGNIQWTIGGWYFQDVNGSVRVLICKGLNSTSVDYQIYLNGGTLTVNAFNGTTYPGAIANGNTVGAWHFVVASYSPAGGGVLSIQVDNGPAATAVAGTLSDTTGGWLILGNQTPLGGATYLYSGRMQNWFLFGRALNATERTFLYNSGNGRRFSELDATFKVDLRAWWPLNEPSGSRADLSGNNNTLTDNNTVTSAAGQVYTQAANNTGVERWVDMSPTAFDVFSGGGAGAPTLIAGARNGLPAVRFDGTLNTMVTTGTLPGSHFCGPQAQTVFVVMWQNVADLESTLYRWDSSSADTNALSGHFAWSDNKFYWYTGAAVGAADGNWNGPEPAGWRNTWHLLECWRSGTAGAIYIEGVPMTGLGGNLTGTFNGTAVHYFRLGADERTGRYFMGDIAEMIIYNRALTPGERASVEHYLMTKWGF